MKRFTGVGGSSELLPLSEQASTEPGRGRRDGEREAVLARSPAS